MHLSEFLEQFSKVDAPYRPTSAQVLMMQSDARMVIMIPRRPMSGLTMADLLEAARRFVGDDMR